MLSFDRTGDTTSHLGPGSAHLLSLLVHPLAGTVAAASGPLGAAMLAVAAPVTITLHPTPTQLPGGTTLQNLADGIGSWALILSLVALVIGAALWALGSHSQNYHQSFVGRRAVLVSAVAALLIGAAPAVITFFYNAGLRVH